MDRELRRVALRSPIYSKAVVRTVIIIRRVVVARFEQVRTKIHSRLYDNSCFTVKASRKLSPPRKRKRVDDAESDDSAPRKPSARKSARRARSPSASPDPVPVSTRKATRHGRSLSASSIPIRKAARRGRSPSASPVPTRKAARRARSPEDPDQMTPAERCKKMGNLFSELGKLYKAEARYIEKVTESD